MHLKNRNLYFYFMMQDTITPPLLKVGDQVAIIATGKQISSLEIEDAKTCFESWGLKVRIGASIGLTHHYLAGKDSDRLADLQQAIDSSEIKAIFFARGGYGTMRILDAVNFEGLQKKPKWLVGFSDLTILHTHIQNSFPLVTIHGIMPVFFPSATTASIQSLKNLLFKGVMHYEIEVHNNWCTSGEVEGKITGGNLAMLSSAVGSESALNCKEKILFIEDLFEYHYKIDRMLQTLQRAGNLEGVKGLIVGSFTHMEQGNPAFESDLAAVILPYFKPLNIPIVWDFPSGHIDDNRALFLGKETKMKVENKKIILTSVK